MTGYERFRSTLEDKGPDKFSFDLGGTLVTVMNFNALAALKKYPGNIRAL